MVRCMPNQAVALDDVFKALADPTRRAVLEQLGRGPASMTELARPFDMALPSFAQHLQMLERAALVRSQKRGRVRTYRLSPRPLKAAERWLDRQRALWERRLDQLDAHLQTMKEPKP
jgi:DNA-binding transcriptional ArsR family regulator